MRVDEWHISHGVQAMEKQSIPYTHKDRREENFKSEVKLFMKN